MCMQPGTFTHPYMHPQPKVGTYAHAHTTLPPHSTHTDIVLIVCYCPLWLLWCIKKYCEFAHRVKIQNYITKLYYYYRDKTLLPDNIPFSWWCQTLSADNCQQPRLFQWSCPQCRHEAAAVSQDSLAYPHCSPKDENQKLDSGLGPAAAAMPGCLGDWLALPLLRYVLSPTRREQKTLSRNWQWILFFISWSLSLLLKKQNKNLMTIIKSIWQSFQGHWMPICQNINAVTLNAIWRFVSLFRWISTS